MPIRILHLEDDDLDAQLVAAQLRAEKLDCEIVRAEGREDFERALKDGLYDAILADYSLPMYDGMTALKAVREIDPLVPFIMLSGTIGEAQAIESVKLGATDFVLKNELVRLVPAINRALREAEEKAAHRESEEMFRTLSEDSLAGIYIMRQGKYLYVNPAFARIFGYERHELVSMDAQALIHPDYRSFVRESIRKRESGELLSEHYEAKGVRKDGAVIDIEVIGIRTAHRGEPAIIGTCLDITERKKADEQKMLMEAEAQRVQKLESLRVLAGGIAHDLNNLMVAVQTNAELALRDLPPDTRAFDHVRSIEKAVGKVSHLAKQIMSYTGKAEPLKEPVDLNDEMKTTAQLLLASISEKASVEYELAPGLPPVSADPQNIQQVIMNLMLNAADSIGGERGMIRLSTGVSELGRGFLERACLAEDVREGRYAWVGISDNGAGMDRDTICRIFEPFYTTKFTGRGLGLAAVFGIVRAHRGAIEVESEKGKGTSFRVFFPLDGAPARERKEEEMAQKDVWKGAGTVLIVDDEEDVSRMTRTVLEQAGYKVLTATDGEEAVQTYMANKENIAVVLMDLIMPGMRGDEAAMKIREVKKDAGIILLSGYHDLNLENLFKGEGKTAIVEKPYKVKTLLESVHGMINA